MAILTKVTQSVILAAESHSAVAEVSQVALLAAEKHSEVISVTQAALLGAVAIQPLPFPIPLVPEIPVKETWNYSTVVNIAEKGNEQRSALWAYPKLNMKFNAILLDETDRGAAYDFLARAIGELFNYPLYMYSTKMQQAAIIGDTKLYFNPASTDLRNGEMVALFDPRLEETRMVALATVDADGGTLATALPFVIPSSWLICPAPVFRLSPRGDYSMNNIDGDIDLTLTGSSVRSVLRPNQSTGLLTVYDGFVILDKRPLADDELKTEFDRNVTWLDTGAVTPRVFKSWKAAYINGERAYKLNRPDGMDYWRAFADHTRGQQNAFLVPTYRADLPLASVPDLGATSIITTNVAVRDYIRSRAYRYIRIQSDAGVIYRRMDDVILTYDAVSGEPLAAMVKLDASIGAGAGANASMIVSFANTCRMARDTLALDHDALDTTMTISIRAVEA